MNDLIYRQAALDAMETWDKFGCDPDGKLVRYDDDKHYIPYVHYEDMVHAIKHLPSAQPEQRWIPCSERLPEDRINVSKWEDKEPTEIVKEEQNMAQNIIGERIAGLLREQDKSQRELARQAGITNASISRYIKGDRVPKGPILANIAKALHTTTDYLVGNEKDSNDPELEYNYTQRSIARNANRWSKKQKLDLVSALFENDD